MRKYLLATACSIIAFSAHAKLQSCDFNLPYDIDIERQEVKLSTNDRELMRIDENNRLYLDEHLQSLNAEQQKLVEQMGNEYRALVPSIAKIAGEAAEIGIKAASLTLSALFVDDPTFSDSITTKLDGISEKIEAHVNSKHLSGNLLSEGELDSALEADLEAVIEEAVSKASGKVVVNVLAKIFSGDPEEMNDLEFRMEMFEKDMEAQVEKEAVKLEASAEELCQRVAELDKVEEKLQRALPAFANKDFIRKD